MTEAAGEPAPRIDGEDVERAAELSEQQDQSQREGLATTTNPPPGNVTPS
jgi:hypothetical protein